jgi:hypothetical protein
MGWTRGLAKRPRCPKAIHGLFVCLFVVLVLVLVLALVGSESIGAS